MTEIGRAASDRSPEERGEIRSKTALSSKIHTTGLSPLFNFPLPSAPAKSSPLTGGVAA